LARADALIAGKQFDEAIGILSEFSRKNPERFSEAQNRLQRIYHIRGEFNAVADQLLDELSVESPDSEKVLKLIARIEELEDSTNPQVRDFLARAREMAQFNYNRTRLERILARGRAQIDQGNYQDALRTYFEGMDIYQSAFFQEGYGENIEGRVSSGIGRVTNVVESFASYALPLAAAAAEIAQVANNGAAPARIGELYSRLSNVMEPFIRQERALLETASYFAGQLATFQEDDPTIGDKCFLSFACYLILGRNTGPVQEGMAGALERYWDSTVGKAATALKNRADAAYTAGLKSAGNAEYANTRQHLTNAQGYSQLPVNLLIKHRELMEGGKSRIMEYEGQRVLLENLDDFLSLKSTADGARWLIQNSDFALRYGTMQGNEKDTLKNWRNGSVPTGEALVRERQINDSLGTLGSNIDALLSQVSQKEIEQHNYQVELEKETGQNFVFPVYISDAQKTISRLRSLVLQEQLESSITYYTIAEDALEKRLASRREQFAQGNRFIAGINREIQDGGTVMERFPAEGLAIMNSLASSLALDIQDGNKLLENYRAEPAKIAQDQAILKFQASTQTTVNELSALRLEGVNLAGTARTQIAQAEAYRLDGVRYYNEAQNALTRQNFDTARDRVTRAAEQFNNSLAIQGSDSLRNEWDTRLVVLGREINRIENELVIRDVRELVNSAKTAYFGGMFDRAEDLLVRAQNRWHVTNFENDEEVEYWLNMVRGAASLRSGRVIPPTAPLYPEMSQLLSEAKKEYSEGVRLFNAGLRPDGIAKFNLARQKTHEVKLMFPVNQEAGMLELQMDRVLDPRAFDMGFEQWLRDAVAGTKRRSIESFAALQNLAEINPRYPGMASIVNQAEIDMGIRPPPPDPRAIARSNELCDSARRILDGNITGQFEVALAQINEAISLNPNNAQATAIKDRLLSRMSRPSDVVMSSQDEEAYNQALMEYQRGNYIMALSIVQRLLQIPQYRNIAKILELQRRVQALL
jgi:hypothetical protein